MKIIILSPGASRLEGVPRLIEHYATLLSKYAAVEIKAVKRQADPRSPKEIKRFETLELFKAVPKDYAVIAMDERGRQLSTVEFAAELDKFKNSSKKGLAFLIGGQEGIDFSAAPEVDMKLALSRMTFPHDLARAILLEQLFRAFSFLDGRPYHRE